MGGNHAFMTYGTRLNLAIKARKSTRAKLAKELEITVQAVGLVINNKTNAFTADNSARAARFLRVNSHWLATGLGDMFDAAPVAAKEPEGVTHTQAFRYFAAAIPRNLTETKKEQVDLLFKRLVRQPEQVDEIADAFADLLKIGDRPTAPDQYSQVTPDGRPFVSEIPKPNKGESEHGDSPRVAPAKGART